MRNAKAIVGDWWRAWSDGPATPERSPEPQPLPGLDRRLRAALWILLILFSFDGVFGHSLWGGNESREGGMIWDMVRSGTYVTPTINGIPFLEKPPLLHLTGVAICRLAGRITPGLVRLPAALYGFGTLVLLILLVRGPRAPDEQTGSDGRELAAWSAAFLCGTAIEFQEYARIVLTDMALVFAVTLSLFLFWRAYLRPGTWRWLAFLLAAAGAFYAKGLIGPALIWASVGLFLAWKRRFRLLVSLSAAYIPVFLLVVIPWVAALDRLGGEAVLKVVFWDNQFGRFFTFGNPKLPHDPFFINREPWHYYLRNLPLYLAPWTLLLVPAFVSWVRRASPFRTPFHAFVASGLVGMAFVLHASSSKVVNYALPLYPLLFAAVAVWFADLLARGRPTPLERWTLGITAGAVTLLMSLVPAVFIGGTFVRPSLFRVGGWTQTASGLCLAIVVLALVVAAVVVLARLLRSPERVLVCAVGPAAYVVLAMAVVQLATPVIDKHRSFEPIAKLAAEECGNGVAVALGTRQYREVGAFTFYLDRRLSVLDRAEDVVSFLRSPDPRAVITPVEALSSMEPQLAAVPHAFLSAGEPGTVSRSYVLLVNEAELVATGRTEGGFEPGSLRTARAPRSMRPRAAPQPAPVSSTLPLQSRVRGL